MWINPLASWLLTSDSSTFDEFIVSLTLTSFARNGVLMFVFFFKKLFLGKKIKLFPSSYVLFQSIFSSVNVGFCLRHFPDWKLVVQGGVCLAFADEVLCWLYGTVKESETLTFISENLLSSFVAMLCLGSNNFTIIKCNCCDCVTFRWRLHIAF